MSWQRTIKRPASLEGTGLHSGKACRVSVRPAPPNSGVVFVAGGVRIPAAPESVVDSNFATTIGGNGTRIQTVEHVLAAAAGLGIDNLYVEVEGGEVPAADGSARPFVTLLIGAGRAQQGAPRRPIAVPYPIRVGSGGRFLHVVPAAVFQISYTLDHDHPAISTQVLCGSPTERSFVDELAPARTYGFLKDVGLMRKHGLARGGSLDNAVVVGKQGVINGLRFPDEFVRHKVLDLIGDLALLGRPLAAHVVGRNAGHALNLELVLAIQRALGLERRPAGAAEVPPGQVAARRAAIGLPGLATV